MIVAVKLMHPCAKRGLKEHTYLMNLVEVKTSLGEGKSSVGDSSSTTDVPRKKRKASIKSKEDAIPLPDPFPLPQHYSTEVKAELKKKLVLVAFTGKVAAAMLCYKHYPIKEDLILNVSQAIIRKYPFMAAPVGTPTVSV